MYVPPEAESAAQKRNERFIHEFHVHFFHAVMYCLLGLLFFQGKARNSISFLHMISFHGTIFCTSLFFEKEKEKEGLPHEEEEAGKTKLPHGEEI